MGEGLPLTVDPEPVSECIGLSTSIVDCEGNEALPMDTGQPSECGAGHPRVEACESLIYVTYLIGTLTPCC